MNIKKHAQVSPETLKWIKKRKAAHKILHIYKNIVIKNAPKMPLKSL